MLGYALLMNCGPYRIPHVHAHGRVAYTNKMRFGAMRGFGVPQVTFASEQQIDEIARRWGWIRSHCAGATCMRAGDRWFGGQPILSNGLAECIDTVERESGWQAAARRLPHRTPVPFPVTIPVPVRVPVRLPMNLPSVAAAMASR